MKCGGFILAVVIFLINGAVAVGQGSVTLSTVQGSTLSVPAAQVVSVIQTNGTFLDYANWMLSGVSQVSAQGGQVSLVTSLEWTRRYSGGFGSSQNTPLAMAVRRDGSIVLCGASRQSLTPSDFITLCYRADGMPLWTNRYDGPGHGSDTPKFVAVNDAGIVWIAGESARHSTNLSLTDVVLIKYSREGFPEWTNRLTSFETNSADPVELVADNSGNAYVRFLGIRRNPPPQLGSVVENAVLKIGPSGDTVWSKRSLYSARDDSGDSIRLVYGMALAEDGCLLLAGQSGGRNRTTGISIMKFDDVGTAVWTNHHPLSFIDDMENFVSDRSGATILTGTRILEGISTEVVMKCSPDGQSVWTNSVGAPAYDGGNVPQVQIDASGNVFFITGSPGASSGLYQILRINSAGVPLWTNHFIRFETTNSMITGSAVDNAGNLYLSGYVPSETNTYGVGMILKFSEHGRLVGASRIGSGNSEFAIDNSGNLYATGVAQAQSGTEIATAKYSDSLVYSPPSDFVGTDLVSLTVTDRLGVGTNAQVEIIVSPGAFQFIGIPGSISFTPAGVELYGEGFPNENPVVLEASADMVSWNFVATRTPVFGFVMFLDPAPDGSRRFYRMSQRP